VSRAKAILDFLVVTRTLIFVLDQQANGRTGCFPFEYPRKELHFIGFMTLTRMARRSGASALNIDLYVLFTERHPGRATIDDCAQRRAVALAKRRYRE
jgi:hypothetical protein